MGRVPQCSQYPSARSHTCSRRCGYTASRRRRLSDTALTAAARHAPPPRTRPHQPWRTRGPHGTTPPPHPAAASRASPPPDRPAQATVTSSRTPGSATPAATGSAPAGSGTAALSTGPRTVGTAHHATSAQGRGWIRANSASARCEARSADTRPTWLRRERTASRAVSTFPEARSRARRREPTSPSLDASRSATVPVCRRYATAFAFR